jgi:hypothetical protein
MLKKSAGRDQRATIKGADFLNRNCMFAGCFEAILLRDPPQNPFSAASVKDGGRRTSPIGLVMANVPACSG